MIYQNKTIFKLILLALSSLFLSACGQQPDSEQVYQWPMIENCDLHQQACTSQMGESLVTLNIRPHPIPIARPLGIEVTLKSLVAKKVELDISGANMYMGYNRVLLTPTKQAGRYVGTSMLAFCTTAKMQWKITLMIHQQDGTQIHIPYLLETKNR